MTDTTLQCVLQVAAARRTRPWPRAKSSVPSRVGAEVGETSYSDAIVAPRETMSYLEDAVGAWFRLKLEDSRNVSPTSCAVPKSMQITVPVEHEVGRLDVSVRQARACKSLDGAEPTKDHVQGENVPWRNDIGRRRRRRQSEGSIGQRHGKCWHEQSHLVARHFDAVNHTHDGWARSFMNALRDVMLTAQCVGPDLGTQRARALQSMQNFRGSLPKRRANRSIQQQPGVCCQAMPGGGVNHVVQSTPKHKSITLLKFASEEFVPEVRKWSSGWLGESQQVLLL